MPRVDVPFVGGAYKGRSVNQNPQECVNFFLETDQEGGKKPIALYGIPGCLLYLDANLWAPGGITPVPTPTPIPTPVPGTHYEFLDSSQTVIKDNWTGLMWQATRHKEQLYYDAAVAYCNELVLADYTDWRLPTRSELVNLVDYSEYRPAMPSIFTDVPATDGAQSFGSITETATWSGAAWYVNVTNGISYYLSKTGDFNWVRAVRGPQRPAAAARLETYTANTVRDTSTGKMWQKADDSTPYTTYAAAVAYAAALSLDGYTDWRLPTIYELESIIDYTESAPALGAVFTGGESDYYWTSTVYAGTAANHYWGIDFNSGIVNTLYGGYASAYVRCIRDAE